MNNFGSKAPMARGKCSVIHTTVEVKVLWKHQLDRAIEWLTERELEFSWEIQKGDSTVHDVFTLVVHDIPWADNLTEFSKILEQCDYSAGCTEDDITPATEDKLLS
jgi:hypothetical protein